MYPMQVRPMNNLVKALKRDIRPAGGINFEVKAQAGDTVDLFLYDVIGWPFIEAQDVVKAIPKNAKRINVRINSPGGDVWDGLAIYNFLKSHTATKYVYVDGLAASAASFVALSGSSGNIRMAKSAFLMIHNAWSIAAGDSKFFSDVSDFLGKVDADIAGIYARKTGKKEEEIREMMNAETWLTSDESFAMGMVDKLYNDDEPVAKNLVMDFNIEAFDKVPEAVVSMVSEHRANIHDLSHMTIREVESLVRDACGIPQAQAKALVSGGFKYIKPSDSEGRDSSEEQLDEVVAMITNHQLFRSLSNGRQQSCRTDQVSA